MLRSLFTAIGGLKNHQVMLDVTANNIANVNTVGYKTQRVAFETALSQTMRGAGAPQAGGLGGTNPTQVGLGMQLGGVSSILTQGSAQSTGQWSDMDISGDGYFIVASDGNDDPTAPGGATAPTQFAFTRAGNFTLDTAGHLVTQEGQKVCGLLYDNTAQPPTLGTTLDAIKIPAGAQSVGVSADGTISATVGGVPNVRIAQLQLARFPNPAGLDRGAGNLLRDTANSGKFVPAVTATDPAVTWAAPGTAAMGLGTLMGSTLEMSNVDLASEFTQMITAQRGFQANSRVISTSDQMLEELVNLKH